MKKAFVIVPTRCEVDPQSPQLASLTDIVIGFTAKVVTEDCIGQAVIIAGKLITSLYLVRNFRLVNVIVPWREHFPAVVGKTDERNNLAELIPISFTSHSKASLSCGKEFCLHLGPIGAIGDPLVTANSLPNKTIVVVMGMSYIIEICDRREVDFWKTPLKLPDGYVGGGIWDLDGKFVGLSLANKRIFSQTDSEMMLALPVESVMNFVETR